MKYRSYVIALSILVCAPLSWGGVIDPSPDGPACGTFANPTPLATLLRVGTCKVAPFWTLTDFSFSVDPDTPVAGDPALADPANIFVAAQNLPGDNLVVDFFSNQFEVFGLQRVGYLLGYTVDPPPNIIRGFEEEMETFTPQNGGIAQISTDICVGGRFPGTGECPETAFLEVHYVASTPPDIKLFDSIGFVEPVNTVGILHHILLDATAGPDASADFDRLRNGALLTTADGAIPEPGSLLLLASGLLGLGLFRARRRT